MNLKYCLIEAYKTDTWKTSWLPETRMAKKGRNKVYRKSKFFLYLFLKVPKNNVKITFHFHFLRDQTFQLIDEFF